MVKTNGISTRGAMKFFFHWSSAVVREKCNMIIASFKKMQIESRTGHFYQASSYVELGDMDNAKNYLNLAIAESGMSIEKFVSTQLFQNGCKSHQLDFFEHHRVLLLIASARWTCIIPLLIMIRRPDTEVFRPHVTPQFYLDYWPQAMKCYSRLSHI